jgi:protein subunit release factor B
MPLISVPHAFSGAGGPHDEKGAVLQINAGAGGLDAMDCAAMLERMYMRWAELEGFNVTVMERSEGEDKTLKSVSFLRQSPSGGTRIAIACGVGN